MIDYDPHSWREHLWDIKGSMLREITYRVAACIAWSAVVVAVHKYVTPVDLPATAHTLVGTALGLLLVFRTNASYDRFWEGRKLWGSIVNDTRSFVRLSRVLLAARPERVHAIARFTIAFAYATKEFLRERSDVGPVARYGLSEADARAVCARPHPPLEIAARTTAILDGARREGQLSDINFAALDDHLRALIAHLGACERIRKTPLPFAYAVHLRRSLLFYAFSLPFALVNPFGWETIAVTFLITYILFGIEEIGVEIEDPFGTDDNDLPLDAICENIEKNLTSLVESPHLAEETRAAREHESGESGGF